MISSIIRTVLPTPAPPNTNPFGAFWLNGHCFGQNGNYLFWTYRTRPIDGNTDWLARNSLTVPFDTTQLNGTDPVDQQVEFIAVDPSLAGLQASKVLINNAGLKLLIYFDQDPTKLYEFALSTAFDITTMTLTGSYDFAGDMIDSGSRFDSMAVSNDESQLYI